MAGMVALFLICYNLSFKESWTMHHRNQFLSAELSTLASIPNIPEEPEQAKDQPQKSEESAIQRITEYCEDKGIVIRSFAGPVTRFEEELTLSYLPLTVKGDFKTVLQLIYFIEQEEKLGILGHVNYEYRRNRESRKQELLTDMYIINMNAHEVQ